MFCHHKHSWGASIIWMGYGEKHSCRLSEPLPLLSHFLKFIPISYLCCLSAFETSSILFIFILVFCTFSTSLLLLIMFHLPVTFWLFQFSSLENFFHSVCIYNILRCHWVFQLQVSKKCPYHNSVLIFLLPQSKLHIQLINSCIWLFITEHY